MSPTFTALAVEGAWLIAGVESVDERGSFARLYERAGLIERGLEGSFCEASLSRNHAVHTLRGLHFQEGGAEVKLVRCVRGAIYDVVLDVRSSSPTFGRWAAVELRAPAPTTLYVPAGCAHGFMTLLDDSDVEYQISVPYDAALQRGVRWDDPAFAVAWPAAPASMSARDRSLPLWSPPARAR